MMRWIQKIQTVIADESGSVLVDYVVIFASMAWMVSIIMTVVTDNRFEIGDTMGDTLEVLIDSFSDGQSGQANFGHAIYPSTGEVRWSDVQFRGIEVRESSLKTTNERPVSFRSLLRSPIDQTVMQPARDIQVHVDQQGRTHLQRSDQEFVAVYNPHNHRWYLVHPVTKAIMLTDLATLQRLGFLQSQHSLIGVTDATLGLPNTALGNSGATIVTVAGAGGIVAGIWQAIRALFGRLSRGRRTPPPPPATRQALIDELRRRGIRHTPEAIVRIERMPNGGIAFLERGNARAGLQHILERHGSQFAQWGVGPNQIPSVIFRALREGVVVGTRGAGTIYRVTINGTTRNILVVRGNNGFIVTAHPIRM
ncbi:MAG: hypothetical protein AAGF95_14865 [Chloroflexota bacterium]